MKKIIIFLSCLFIFSFSNISLAEESSPPSCSDHNFECVLVGGLGINFANQNHLSIYTSFRLGYLERIPLVLEINGVFPTGFGANLLFYVYHGNRVLVHLIDFGIFYSLNGEMSAIYIPREFDLSFGAGVEVLATSHLAITLDWRVFFADPFHVLPNYADWGIEAYKESLRGVVWLGMAYIF